MDATSAESLETKIRDFISARELPLYRMMSFQLGWVDENGDRSTIPTRPRVHGQFAMSVAKAVGGGLEDPAATFVPYGVSIELLYNFSLIHEDVEDGNTEHNGRPSVWWTWGPAQAINAGDGMHAMARMALFALTEQGEPVEKVSEALQTLDEAVVMMCEGEYTDIMMQEQIGLTSHKYLDMVYARSGALFGASARIAAISVGQTGIADALFKYGQSVGAARQIAADYMLFWGSAELDPVQHGRLLTKKKNLPVAHAIETAPITIKKQLGDIYAQRVIDPSKISNIAELLEESGAKEFTLEAVKQTLEKAQASLEESSIEDSSRAELMQLAEAVAGFDA